MDLLDKFIVKGTSADLFYRLIEKLTLSKSEFKAKEIEKTPIASGKGGEIYKSKLSEKLVYKVYKNKFEKKQMGGGILKNPYKKTHKVSDTINCLVSGYKFGKVVPVNKTRTRIFSKKAKGSNPLKKVGVLAKTAKTLILNCNESSSKTIKKGIKRIGKVRHRPVDYRLKDTRDIDMFTVLYDAFKIIKQHSMFSDEELYREFSKISNGMFRRRNVNALLEKLSKVKSYSSKRKMKGGVDISDRNLNFTRDLNEVIIQRILAKWFYKHNDLSGLIGFSDVFIYNGKLYIEQEVIGIKYKSNYCTNANELLRLICLNRDHNELRLFLYHLKQFIELLNLLRDDPLNFRHLDCKLANVFLRNTNEDYKFIVSDLDLCTITIRKKDLDNLFSKNSVPEFKLKSIGFQSEVDDDINFNSLVN